MQEPLLTLVYGSGMAMATSMISIGSKCLGKATPVLNNEKRENSVRTFRWPMWYKHAK